MRSGTYLLLKNSADNNIAENYMMKDFTDFILHLILSGRLNQEGWGGLRHGVCMHKDKKCVQNSGWKIWRSRCWGMDGMIILKKMLENGFWIYEMEPNGRGQGVWTWGSVKSGNLWIAWISISCSEKILYHDGHGLGDWEVLAVGTHW